LKYMDNYLLKGLKQTQFISGLLTLQQAGMEYGFLILKSTASPLPC